MEERRMNRLKQMPEEGRRHREMPNNLRVQPEEGRRHRETWSNFGVHREEGDREERRREQTGHALVRAWPRQVRGGIQTGNREN
ncbi:hypothetical protein NDU88_002082 [Pleurodeles waltl]|uniref:Uncharacterized protein n=1 Tax=Pleurodeles waltl TaxID=8319 RepID=A0AAV7P7B1_PLEWA|nr:hypothetical protein NDU88_002082 [Pleurodeles waltl]